VIVGQKKITKNDSEPALWDMKRVVVNVEDALEPSSW